jgi:hypothetical protein
VLGFFSIQRSGIVNGFTQVIAFPFDASAVATALMSAVAMPKYWATSVLTVRLTVTRTRFGVPISSLRNSTSAGFTSTSPFITLL